MLIFYLQCVNYYYQKILKKNLDNKEMYYLTLNVNNLY